MRVFVTGMGIVSPIGFTVDENLSNLRKGKSGISQAEYFASKYASVYKFGEVKITTESLLQQVKPKNPNGLSRTCLLAFKAFEEAIADARIEGKLNNYDTAFVSASTVGGMCLTDQLYEDANLKSNSSPYLKSYGCSAHTLFIAESYGLRGYINTINTACSSSANAIMLGARLIKSKRAKRVIVGGTDSLAKYTVNGFNSLRIVAESACRPFDENRDGLNLGEGAAYLVLEAENECDTKKAYAEVTGFGNANDAFHASTISDEATGVVNSITEAIETAALSPSDIDYINAHGTGTPNNDLVELTGFSKIFDTIPPFNSTKAFTGHTLGAAGAIEAAYSILSIVNSELYPSLNFNQAIKEFNESPITSYQKNVPLFHVLSNSYGFSGSCTSLIFSKIN